MKFESLTAALASYIILSIVAFFLWLLIVIYIPTRGYFVKFLVQDFCQTTVNLYNFMISEKIIIRNEVGLHARPASEFVRTAEKFSSSVRLCKDGIWVDGKSILAILTLAAEKGSEVILEVKGKDEEKAFKALKAVLLGS